jgi:hypothetical protein
MSLKVRDIASSNGVYPLEQTVNDAVSTLQELETKMNQIEDRTANVEWNNVPLIGSTAPNSSRLKYVQSGILEYLKQLNDENEKVSAWDVTHEYRDAIDVGSVKGIERIKHVFGLSS